SAIYFNVDRPLGGHDIWMLPMGGGEKSSPRVFLQASANRDWLAISPDSRWMLFRVPGERGNQVLLRSLGSKFGEWAISDSGTSEGHWRVDRKEIYFISGRNMMAQGVEASGSEIRLGTPVVLFQTPQPNSFGRNAFAVTPDGQWFVIRTGR